MGSWKASESAGKQRSTVARISRNEYLVVVVIMVVDLTLSDKIDFSCQWSIPVSLSIFYDKTVYQV